jgi:arsenite methyltransferase
VISNGVVTGQGRSVHRSGPGAATGWRRLAIADIVSQRQLKHSIVCDADLWAACIGGAAQQDAYQELIENAGLAVTTMWRNDYEFISQRARDASARYGVKSISLLAVKSSG